MFPHDGASHLSGYIDHKTTHQRYNNRGQHASGRGIINNFIIHYNPSAPLLRSASPPASNMLHGQPEQQYEGQLSVSIDFGTTFSGVAYASNRIAGGRAQQILHWPGSLETFRKIPTCLLYDEQGRLLAWGLEAKNADIPGAARCEWFKLFLEPAALRGDGSIDPRLPSLPPGKQPIDLIIDFLSCLWEYAKDQIFRDIGAVESLKSADVWLTVPAAWDACACDIMREAAITARLVESSRPGDMTWRDRLRITTEPEAAVVHCARLPDLHHLKPNQNFIICNAGSRTVDSAVYKIIGQMANLEIADMYVRSGANCGSLILDLRFRELVRLLLDDHPAHLDPISLDYFMWSFSETDKHNYRGTVEDAFHANREHVPLYMLQSRGSLVGLINGQLAIPGNLLKKEVFDPVVNEVVQLIEEQIARVDQPIHALLLVGGFARSEYLKQRVEDQFSSRIPVVVRPADADAATLLGAATYGLARRPLVSSFISPRSYLMKVDMPAEQEDWLRRPAYIKNNAGVAICENRLQYLVSKGAILRKGQRLTTKICTFARSAQDSSFVVTMYTSDTDKLMRYSDEGETTELCRWTVDQSSLPTFKYAVMLQTGGFYTEFELGLELDGAEVQVILLCDMEEWGRVTIDFLV